MRRNPVFVAALVIATAVVILGLRQRLAGVESPNVAPWGAQLILGYYLSILVLSARSLLRQLHAVRPSLPEQTLLLLALTALTSDLVLNNVREASVMKLDASYGPVILWDTATFFVWLRAIDYCEKGKSSAFKTSLLVAIAPVLKLGRELMWLPFDSTKAYIDLAVGDVAISSWVLLWWLRHGRHSRGRLAVKAADALSLAVALGCFYYLFATVEELIYLAYRPAGRTWAAWLAAGGFPGYVTNFMFLFAAVLLLIVVCSRNPKRLGERLSLPYVRRQSPQ